MDVTNLMTLASEWGSTALFVGLLLVFFAALGRSGSRPTDRHYNPASTFAQDTLRGVLDGVKRLSELTRRRALPPWDDVDRHFTGNRTSPGPDHHVTITR